MLHDEHTGDHLEVSAAAWAVLASADGTRERDGIAAAATRLGVNVTTEVVDALLDDLAERGALLEGPPAHAPDVVTPRARSPEVAALPIAALPDYRFDCDGSGGCCRAYGSVLFTPEDRARARGWLPTFQVGPVPPQRWFTPSRGSAPTPLNVPVSCQGGCGFLGDDGRCEIHRRGGLAAKPVACAAFPLLACADGVSVRVTVSPECACVLHSHARARGEPLVPGLSRGAELPATTVIDELPPEVVLEAGLRIPIARLRARVDDAIETLPVEDPARVCWDWAQAWGLGGAPPPLGEYVDALATRARGLLGRMRHWRSEDDWVLGSLRWLVATLHFLGDAEVRASLCEAEAEAPAVENFYLRASLWGYLGFCETPVCGVLRAHAVKIWIARAMDAIPLAPRLPRVEAERSGYPLAVLSMLLRGHGLDKAWSELGGVTPENASGSA